MIIKIWSNREKNMKFWELKAGNLVLSFNLNSNRNLNKILGNEIISIFKTEESWKE